MNWIRAYWWKYNGESMSESRQKKVFISYARKAEHSIIQELFAWNRESLHDSWEILYDENRLYPGNSIKILEKEIGGAEYIIILLSQEYFQSPHCLRELKYLYQKGADKLMPVSVFVGDSTPEDIQESEIVQYWETADNDKELAEMIPVLLAWLLGSYDAATKSYDTFFTVLSGADKDACAKVFKALENKKEPRYKYVSPLEKREIIHANITRIVEQLSKPESKSMAKKLEDLIGYSTDDIADQFSQVSNGSDIKRLLAVLANRLKNKAKYQVPSKELDILVGVTRDILGWFLLTVLDDVKLTVLIHQLNHMGDSARLELFEEIDSGFQVLVSAIACSPVIFMLKEKKLTGKGELVLPEGGINSRNVAGKIEGDIDYVHSYAGFKDQNNDFLGHPKTQEVAKDSLKELFEKKTYFLKASQSQLAIVKNEVKICATLGKQFPELTLILTLAEEDQDQAVIQQYMRSNLQIGSLNESIIDIYKHIDKLTQKTTAGTNDIS